MTLFLVVLVVLLMIIAFVLWTLYSEARDRNLAYVSQLRAVERRLDVARAALVDGETGADGGRRGELAYHVVQERRVLP
jgi:uncharacterized membrane protein YsdA (DUF1294 family)